MNHSLLALAGLLLPGLSASASYRVKPTGKTNFMFGVVIGHGTR